MSTFGPHSRQKGHFLLVFHRKHKRRPICEILEGQLIKLAETFLAIVGCLCKTTTPWTLMDTNMKIIYLNGRQSTDLSPIENILGWLKHQLIRRQPRTISGLKHHLDLCGSGKS